MPAAPSAPNSVLFSPFPPIRALNCRTAKFVARCTADGAPRLLGLFLPLAFLLRLVLLLLLLPFKHKDNRRKGKAGRWLRHVHPLSATALSDPPSFSLLHPFHTSFPPFRKPFWRPPATFFPPAPTPNIPKIFFFVLVFPAAFFVSTLLQKASRCRSRAPVLLFFAPFLRRCFSVVLSFPVSLRFVFYSQSSLTERESITPDRVHQRGEQLAAFFLPKALAPFSLPHTFKNNSPLHQKAKKCCVFSASFLFFLFSRRTTPYVFFVWFVHPECSESTAPAQLFLWSEERFSSPFCGDGY